MNWKFEAKRVAAAFGVEGRCKFLDKGAGKRLTKDGADWIRIDQGGEVWEFRFMVIENLTRIDARDNDDLKVMITVDHRGEIVNLWKQGLESRLVKPFVNLGMLTDEIGKALGATVTATERIEWMLEYEARLKPTKHHVSP